MDTDSEAHEEGLHIGEAMGGGLLLYLRRLPLLTLQVLPLVLLAALLDAYLGRHWQSAPWNLQTAGAMGQLLLLAAVLLIAYRRLLPAAEGTPRLPAGLVLLRLLLTLVLVAALGFAGLFLFIIPGLIAFGLGMVAPIFVVRHGQGPLEAFGSSLLLARGHLLKLALAFFFLVSVYFAIAGVAAHFLPLGAAPAWARLVRSIVFQLLGLYVPAFAVAIYLQLRGAA